MNPNGHPVRLADYDLVIVNTSAGKDSQAMMDALCAQADAEGIDRDRLVAVHADLGRVEWEGTKELAAEQAAAYGLRFEAIARPQGDLLDHIEQLYDRRQAAGDDRVAWPSSTARYCTSDHKRGQVSKVITALVRELDLGRPVRVLNCLGFRAEESPARAKRPVFETDRRLTGKGTVKQVDTWLPILDWTTEQVWATIRRSGVRHHRAYDLGMPRLSCVFCVFAPREALTIAALHNPDLGAEYARLERKMGHTFRVGLSIADVVDEADRMRTTGDDLEHLQSTLAERAGDWCM